LLCVVKDKNLFNLFLKSSDNYMWYNYIVFGLVYCLKVVDRTPCIRNWGCFCSQMKDREAPIHLYLITVEPRFTNLIRSWRPFVNRNVRKPKLFFPQESM
jgi:hypothetical protein